MRVTLEIRAQSKILRVFKPRNHTHFDRDQNQSFTTWRNEVLALYGCTSNGMSRATTLPVVSQAVHCKLDLDCTSTGVVQYNL